MTLSRDIARRSGPICEYLRATFPGRSSAVGAWTDQLAAHHANAVRVDYDIRPIVGTTFEWLIGLDLAPSPPYHHILNDAPADIVEPILRASGY